MPSLVDELENEALRGDVSLSLLLLKVKVIAAKLSLQQPLEWVHNELSGYKRGADVPTYRHAFGVLQGRPNDFAKWQTLSMPDHDSHNTVSTHYFMNSISGIEHLLAGDGERLDITLGPEQVSVISDLFGQSVMQVRLIIAKNALAVIPTAVRTKIIDWTLALGAVGIKGDGLSFSAGEKAAANNPVNYYNIANIAAFSGNMGSVQDNATVITAQTNSIDYIKLKDIISQALSLEDRMGLAEAKQAELHVSLQELRDELEKPQPELNKIQAMVMSLKDLLGAVTTNVLVIGIIQALNSVAAN